MKKLVFLTMIFVLAMSSIGMCAVPDTNSGIGSIQLGYNYYNLDKTSSGIDQGKKGLSEIYGSVGIGFGYGVFVNHAQVDKTKYTDFGLKIGTLLPSVAFTLGQRQMATDNADSKNDLFFGAAINQSLPFGVAAYATYQKGAHFKDQVIGITYDMTSNSQINVSWKDYEDNNNATFKGFGAGVNLKF